MVQTFTVSGIGEDPHFKDFTDAKEAGAAFFNVDASQRPVVIHGLEDNRARFMASTEIHGTYENGEQRFVKRLPGDDREGDRQFRSGYFDALETSVNERMKSIDWEQAKPDYPSKAPNLDHKLYDDLEDLSNHNFERAVKAWDDHAPPGTTGPTFVDRKWKQQLEMAHEPGEAIDAVPSWATSRSPAYGVVQIDDKPATSVRFDRSETDGTMAYNVAFYLGSKSVARLNRLDADALADAVGDKNAKAIIEHINGKGTLNGEQLHYEYGLSPEESARRQQLKESLKVADLENVELDAPGEKNIVARGHEKELLALELDKLGMRAEGKRILNDTAAQTDGKTDQHNQQLTEREKIRQIELMEQVHNQFRVSGSRFHFKDQPNKLAFKDKGERMVSASNDERVAKAMATMAEAKGWKTITVSGHPDFKREVWMEATLRGLDVSGYKPTEQELKMMEARREHNLSNVVEKSAERKSNHQQKAGTERNATEKPIEKAGKAAERVYEGRIIEHGDAKYNHDPEEKPNYYVKLETPSGEKTVWGIDLKRAMSESKAQTGDNVKLEFKGKETVKVEALQRDKEGKVIGSKEVETHRNTWEVEKSEKFKVVEAVASAFIDSKVKDPAQRETLKAAINARLVEREQAGTIPSVPIYDKEAPIQSSLERIGPQVEQNAERTR